MSKISQFQIYCMLMILSLSLGFLITPKLLTEQLGNNAWLAVLAALIPASLLIYVYVAIIKKSYQPFPLLLEEHLGVKLGKVVGFLYIFFFFFTTSWATRTFIDFIESHVLPGTPISIFVGSMLFISFLGVKSGLAGMARMAEIIVYIAMPFTFLILLLTLLNNPYFHNLAPFGANMDYYSFSRAILDSLLGLLTIFPVLTLAFYSAQPQNLAKTMFIVILSYILILTLTTLTTIIVLGGQFTNYFYFPTFVAVRMINLGEFIQNIDIIFIGIWVMGIFGRIALSWFMICYTAKGVFNLPDYRFLAAPTALIIGFTSIQLSPNIVELTQIITAYVVPLLYFAFLLLVPLLLFVITMFKAPVKQNSEIGETGQIQETSAK